MPRLLDLSHAGEAGMVTYKGLPGPGLRDHLSREAERPRQRAARIASISF